MPQGTLEVLLVSAKKLENTDFLCKMDPFVILTCRTQTQQSSVASNQGTNPEWNETFVFTVSEGVKDIHLKIMDQDLGTRDDFVGELTIPLASVFAEGRVPPHSYTVVKNDHYCGEIRLGLKFTPDQNRNRGMDESFGGWKESAAYY
ncbi:hypothetical protein HN51_036719 [Arachis hypogaea]|uniref:C2 domain-containing protein n=3 Tax=Arachis TaxID=3817 RepID=A0A445DTI6_ARAHY|nr:16 kDa phloem protein 2-like isoform X1 [Arachis duranensis]XP_016189557.1 C2 domain-containing protein At1g63220-like isoform X1 [Arachis ipaensis]XP_025637400.1 C2 domain-containing protein At1g63220-like [Arachis hypogaea]XP_025689355.1 C2 domain-containing protein At1g63220-like isoform X1 [Arachis hypogaea]QHO02142.1 C2 domain-containing protein [Arachis hypogaea]QHO58168.1 C2 domain-containing protein [Arachis hypogaea]RYR19282.1 hypothetical protein Ahy_B03g064031 [Arachis hypogaea]